MLVKGQLMESSYSFHLEYSSPTALLSDGDLKTAPSKNNKRPQCARELTNARLIVTMGEICIMMMIVYYTLLVLKLTSS